MGSPDFAVASLRALAGAHEVVLVVSQPDKPAGRGGQLQAPAVKLAAQDLKLPILQPKSARTGELRDALAASGAELAVVVAYGKILPRDVLDAVPGGFVNVHASLLPRYRGAAPVQWAVIHGQAATGVSIMQLDEGMDTGPVYLEREVAIDPDETSGELLARLAPLGAATLLEALATPHVATPQDPTAATYAPMLTKADGAIDFARPAGVVAARIRGVDPWPGAHATLRGQLIKLFRARAGTGVESYQGTKVESYQGTNVPGYPGIPGSVLSIDSDGLHVACGDGAVTIRELQAAGRKRMTAQQFAAGRGVAVGDVLT